MSRPTDRLIATLANDLQPVRRLASPTRRALLWMAAIAVCAAAILMSLGLTKPAGARMAHVWNWIELAATLATAACGMLAAFNLAVPGRSRLWVAAPFAPLLVWIVTTVAGLMSEPAAAVMRPSPESMACFRFVLAAGAAVAVALVVALRTGRAIEPGRSAASAGIGAGATAVFLLTFCHPFALNVMDFGVHLLSVAIVVVGTTLVGRALIKPRKLVDHG